MRARLERGREEWRNLPVFASPSSFQPSSLQQPEGKAGTLAGQTAGCIEGGVRPAVVGGVTAGASQAKVAGQLGQVCGLLIHMCTHHKPGCALRSLGLHGRARVFPHHPGPPPVGSGSDTDPLGNWGKSLFLLLFNH